MACSGRALPGVHASDGVTTPETFLSDFIFSEGADGGILRDFGCVCAFGVCVFKGRNAFLTLTIFIL